MLVTIAIPVYNAGKYIRDTIKSVLNQTYKNYELIIINDGSTDDSMAIARSFKDNRIRIIDDGENRGLVSRLNQTVTEAQGELYARMDADDIMHTERIKKQVDYLISHPEVDVVGTALYSIDSNNNIIGAFSAREKVEKGQLPGFIHPSVMGRTKWFRSNRYDKKYVRAEDMELWLRTRDMSTFANINDQLIYYREFGVPSVRKYILSKKTELLIFSECKKYGLPRMVGAKRIIRSLLQISFFTLASMIGKQDFVIKLRKRKPIEFDTYLAKDDLNKALMD